MDSARTESSTLVAEALETRARTIVSTSVGLIGYGDALALQEQLVVARRAGEIEDQLLLLQHPHVITLGTSAHSEHIPVMTRSANCSALSSSMRDAVGMSLTTAPASSSATRSSISNRIVAICTATFATSKKR